MDARPTRTVEIPVLRDLMERLLKACGCDDENARVAAGVFLEADMRGVLFQGLDHMYSMIAGLREGKIDPKAKPVVAREGEACALIDGRRGPGQVACIMAADLAVAKAKKAGAAAVGVTRASDLFMIGYYAGRMADAGCVGLAFSDAVPNVRPEGGVEKLLGTNPMAIAVPAADGRPFIHDLSTCAQSASRVRQAAYHDEDLPEALALDIEGRPLVKAKDIRARGAIGPLAGGKGFGLGLFVGFLSGPLTGSATGGALKPWYDPALSQVAPKGHFFIAVDPAAFGDPKAFRAAVGRYIGEIKASGKAPGVSGIRVPGERALAERERSAALGHVVMYEAIWRNTARIAGELGVAMPT
jgi:LDH2 family malate/lactate/ureidoglycolate dehydrogenase